MKISSRDVKIFILGFVSFFLVESICDWESSVKQFKRGWNESTAGKSK